MPISHAHLDTDRCFFAQSCTGWDIPPPGAAIAAYHCLDTDESPQSNHSPTICARLDIGGCSLGVLYSRRCLHRSCAGSTTGCCCFDTVETPQSSRTTMCHAHLDIDCYSLGALYRYLILALEAGTGSFLLRHRMPLVFR